MTSGPLLLVSAVTLCAIMVAAWQTQRATSHHGWADVFWSFGVGAVGIATILLSNAMDLPERQYLVAALLAAWSLRLGSHILCRTLRSRDDPRYEKLRKEWGEAANIRMFFFLQSQALAGLVLVVCVYVAAARPATELELGDYLGVLTMLIALAGEATADSQLKRFNEDPANYGKVCDTGLWRWSRHPNYFFEWLAWVSYVLIGADFGGDYLIGWLSVAAPVLMYVLLRHVSGVPPLEQHMLATRPDFRDYQRRTSVFFPLPPRDINGLEQSG